MIEYNQISANTGSLTVSALFLKEVMLLQRRWCYKVVINNPEGNPLVDVEITIPASNKFEKTSERLLMELVQNAYAYAGHLDEYGDVDLNSEDEDDESKKLKHFYDRFAPNKRGDFSLSETIFNLADCEEDERRGDVEFRFTNVFRCMSEVYKPL
jgi:hypothetical protein